MGFDYRTILEPLAELAALPVTIATKTLIASQKNPELMDAPAKLVSSPVKATLLQLDPNEARAANAGIARWLERSGFDYRSIEPLLRFAALPATVALKGSAELIQSDSSVPASLTTLGIPTALNGATKAPGVLEGLHREAFAKLGRCFLTR
jgi:hypothetical protein